MKLPLLLVELATSDVPVEPHLKDDSWLLTGASSYHDLRTYCFIPPNATKAPSLGTICDGVLPQEGNKFDLELGVNLPDLFPNLNNNPEYTLQVFRPNKELKTLCFSNVMTCLRFEKDGMPFHALLPRRAIPTLRSGEIDFLPKDASVELLRTFVSIRYVIHGTTAEDALESNIEQCMHDFIERLNHVLKVFPLADPSGGLVYSVAYSRATFKCFYFIMQGHPDSQLGHGMISPHIGRSMLRPPDLPKDFISILHQYMEGTKVIDEIDALLQSAKLFYDGGVTEYVLLLSVIAAEVATQRFVRKIALAAGVSKSRFDNLENDLTYSLMLNLILQTITPKDKKPDKELLGKMNRARQLRNEYMHNGLLPSNEIEIAAIYQSTKEYVEYLRKIDSCVANIESIDPDTFDSITSP